MLVARNMDWKTDMPTALWAMPHAIERHGLRDDPNPLTWHSRHNSVVASVYDGATSDGVNEHGLAGHILWLAECNFGDRDTALPGLSASMWLQFVLDRFATVAECVGYMRDHPFQVRGQQMTGTAGATIHLGLEDATGDSAVVEYLRGEPVVHHGRAYTTLTNSPSYDEQLAHLADYDGFGGDRPLPGTTDAADRFVRAAYYLARLPEPDDNGHAYASLLSVVRNAAQPFNATADPDQPNNSATIWSTLTDLTNGVYAFASSRRPDIVWTRLDRLDFSAPRRLDPLTPGLVGDVSDAYRRAEPFAFASA